MDINQYSLEKECLIAAMLQRNDNIYIQAGAKTYLSREDIFFEKREQIIPANITDMSFRVPTNGSFGDASSLIVCYVLTPLNKIKSKLRVMGKDWLAIDNPSDVILATGIYKFPDEKQPIEGRDRVFFVEGTGITNFTKKDLTIDYIVAYPRLANYDKA